jgi:hypothetical protein
MPVYLILEENDADLRMKMGRATIPRLSQGPKQPPERTRP